MKTGIDSGLILSPVKSGLYHYFRQLTREIGKLSSNDVDCLIYKPVLQGTSPQPAINDLKQALGGLPVRIWNWPSRLGGLWLKFGFLNRYDVLFYSLFSTLPDLKYPARVFLIPDCIHLELNYSPELTQMTLAYFHRAIRQADAIIVFSEHTRQDIVRRFGCSPDLIHPVPLAAGPEFIPASPDAVARMRATLGLGEEPYILFPSTIEKKKNHSVLIHAFIHLIHQHPELNHRLVFAGPNPTGGEAAFSPADNVVLPPGRFLHTGYVEDMATVISGADLVVYPSLYEGFGLPILEAMACGVPVISSNATSLPEVAGDAALLFDPFNALELADKMKQVLTNQSLYASLKEAGLKRASQFSWNKTAAAYLDIFRRAHEKKHHRK